jgi:hypothetical protein
LTLQSLVGLGAVFEVGVAEYVEVVASGVETIVVETTTGLIELLRDSTEDEEVAEGWIPGKQDPLYKTM